MALFPFLLSKYDHKFLLIVLFTIYHLLTVSLGQVRVGFYSQTCPDAESIVHSVVQEAIQEDPKMAAKLLRLSFHDCFVEGCDGSILIEGNGDVERGAFGHQGLVGFEVIEQAKAKLERVCEGVVSCADIVVLAARDAVSLANGPFYQVPTGRRDGLVSKRSLADDLPEVDEPIQVLQSKFREKGLDDKDLVLLNGAHTLGTTACFFMKARLYNFTQGQRGGSDPSIDPSFLKKLKKACPLRGDINVRIPLDAKTELVFDDQILHNIKEGFAVIASDARLMDNKNTKKVVESYVSSGSSKSRPSFFNDFADAMVKMSLIGVKTGSQGEIRKVCRSFN